MTFVLTKADLVCSTSGKAMFPTEERAMQSVERAWTKKDWAPTHGRMPMRAYLCDDCGWWHMTALREERPTV